MYRNRIRWVLGALALVIAAQAVGAVMALREAEQQIVQGRIASDIHRSFIEMSAAKQRLHTWVTQFTLGGGGASSTRDDLVAQMRATMLKLHTLNAAAQRSEWARREPQEQAQRTDSLEKLAASIEVMVNAVVQAQRLDASAGAAEALREIKEVFEYAGGNDLRQLIAQSITREQAAMSRERAAATKVLEHMQLYWIGMAIVLVLAAVVATVYFGHALRRPLDRLSEAAHELGNGQWSHRIRLSGGDEFSAVASSMNSMAEQIERHQRREAQARADLEQTVRQRTEELHLANKSLRETDLRRRQLLADISHELRTPTTALRGEAEVTLRSKSRNESEYRDTLQKIVAISRQLGRVIDDLLSMARSDLEALLLIREPLPLIEPLQDALAQASALAASANVRLEFDTNQFPEAYVLGDRQRLCQLVLVLLDNAIRYSHPGGIVRLALESDSTAGTQWCITISDCGIGIAKDDMPYIFERHFRGQSARRHSASGSGLGLQIAQSLAHAHSGSLTMTSTPGQGTEARIVLPGLAQTPTIQNGQSCTS